MSDVFEKQISGTWVALGYSFRGIRLGFQLDRYEFSCDLAFVWFSVELPKKKK